jgi:hypothetical protein
MSGTPILTQLVESGTVGEEGLGLEAQALKGSGIDLASMLSGIGKLQGGQGQQQMAAAPPITQGKQVDILAPLLSLLMTPPQDERKMRRTSLL